MSGGISQLVAIGAQDAYLTGSPQVSFFRAMYKRHTNFAMTRENQVIQGTQQKSNMSTIRFERKGDMLSYIYFYKKNADGEYDPIDLSDTDDQIKKTELYIGGQLIDSEEAEGATARGAIGAPNAQSGQAAGYGSPSYTFCKYFEAALPLVALQYHDVEMRVYWKNDYLDEFYPVTCVANYIYLDDDERTFFAQNAHNILIEQLQRNTFPATQTMLDLSFSHPVKYIVADNLSSGNESKPTYKMQINGVDVGDEQPVGVSSQVAGARNGSSFYAITVAVDRLVIPYSLQSGAYQPTGTLNFSRLDSARIIIDRHGAPANDNDIVVNAVNYNVLRIQNGMGGLEYAN